MADLNISLIQTDLPWQGASENRELLEQILDATIDSTDLIVLPEMFTCSFDDTKNAIAESMPGETVDWMRIMAVSYQAAVCGTIAVKENGERFNRFLFVTPEGKVRHYDKRHLFRMLGEHKRYASGNRQPIIKWRDWRIMPLVCYDLRFPVWCRNTESLNYDLIVCPANWPAARDEHWQTLLRARAIENLAYVAGTNRVGKDGNDLDYAGHSQLIDPAGEVLLDAGDKIGGYAATISKEHLEAYRKSFPTHLDADPFLLASPLDD